MRESKTATWIKKYYVEPPIILIEHQFYHHDGMQFEINTKIWVDQHLPEYRIAIPEKPGWDKERLASSAIEMRFITYIPTGRVVYDNTLPAQTAIVYEYILESLLGKKDLIHK